MRQIREFITNLVYYIVFLEIALNYRYVAKSGYPRNKLRVDGNDILRKKSETGQILPKTDLHFKLTQIELFSAFQVF